MIHAMKGAIPTIPTTIGTMTRAEFHGATIPPIVKPMTTAVMLPIMMKLLLKVEYQRASLRVQIKDVQYV